MPPDVEAAPGETMNASIRTIASCLLASAVLALPVGAAGPSHSTTTAIETPEGTYYLHQETSAVVLEGDVLYAYDVVVTLWKETNGAPGLQRVGPGADEPACDLPQVGPGGLFGGHRPIVDCGAHLTDEVHY